ncbi:MAG: hypothetical protein C4581_07440 [Nitrospiraceae bacterium]|nr:MAG: hypothetical protein C4581_07440 [Nitrospiraceae bacterium]
MENELYNKFNEEINRYRNSLLFYAKKCDWDTFKDKAGRLFDYVESFEMSVLEKKFFRITKIIIVALCFIVILILKMNPQIYPDLARVNELMTLAALAICGFEVFFLFNYRMYIKGKISCYKKRRERFILNLQRDFEVMTVSMAA